MDDFEIICNTCNESFSLINACFCCPCCGSTDCYRKSNEGTYLRGKVRELDNRIKTLEEIHNPTGTPSNYIDKPKK